MDAQPTSRDLGPTSQFGDAWVVIPAYNEAVSLAAVVAELKGRFPHVVVVDDGSTDGTPQVARAADALILRHRVNLGQGAALQTGITFALRRGAQRIATFDGDGQHRADDLTALLEALDDEDCEIALGSRFLRDADSIPVVRRTLLRIAVLFTRATTALAVTDAHNGLRAFSRRAALEIDLKSNRMAHASELLDQIARSGLPYRELPVRVRYTDYSLDKGQRSSAAFRVLFDYLVSRVFD